MSDLRIRTLRAFSRTPSLRAAARRYAAGVAEPAQLEQKPATPQGPKPKGHSVVDSAIYCNGSRVASPESLADTYQELHESPHSLAWIGLYRPDRRELNSLAKEFDLHELAIEDAIQAHQRPKLERYGEVLFTVLRSAKYQDDVERVEFGELHVFTGKDFVVTVRHAESPDLGEVRKRLEETPELLKLGPEAVLYAILDQVVDV